MARYGDYVVAIHVPVHLDGKQTFVATDWARALVLLRDSLSQSFARLVVVAPSLPSGVAYDQELVSTRDHLADVEFRPSLDLRERARHYWLRGGRRRWLADVRAALTGADAAHLGMSDLFKPINHDAFREACRHTVTTVFVRDTDELAKREGLIRSGLVRDRWSSRLHDRLYDRAMRAAVRRADLTLLKGPELMARYAQVASNAFSFDDTSFMREEIAPEDLRSQRVHKLLSGRPIRLVYCGRFERRKGLDHAIRIVARARSLGVDCSLELIGDGSERNRLEALTRSEGVTGAVRFAGRRPYGPELLRELADYDALFFTPLGEDTPRMIFDGYAAGLPLLAYSIPYVRARQKVDAAVATIPEGDIEAGARKIAHLDANRQELAELSGLAHQAALLHCADAWYARRAEWTLEAHERRLAKMRSA